MPSWTEFKAAYGQLIPWCGYYTTTMEAAAIIIASADRKMRSATPVFEDKFLEIGLLEIVQGWTVVAAQLVAEPPEGDEVMSETTVYGRWFFMDNGGTAFDPGAAYRGPAHEGQQAPEGALLLGEFQNSNNWGYWWVVPAPIEGSVNFSTTWDKKWVRVVPPEGAEVGCIMEK